MEHFSIICKVTEPTELVNSLVTVQKANGSLTVCLCPKDLNDAIKRPHYPSKTLDDILPDLTGVKVFSKLDARSGYWSIKLTEKSSYYTTFNTPFGRYRFLRLPFGIKSANDLFQQKMDECLESLPGVKTIVDDIVVFGKDQATHDKNLKLLMTRCREKHIRLSPHKTEIGKNEMPFFGHVLTLLQNDRPVSFDSKSLTPTEINYNQIEKELYAILFGCKRFHQYVYGRRINVQTDHKPLIAICRKSLHMAPPRLQRMLLSLSRYDINLIHVSGKDMPIADTLSRKFISDTYPDMIEELDEDVHAIISSYPVTDQKIEYIRTETRTDAQLQLLTKAIKDGWPDDRSECPKQLLDFWNYRDELTEVNGIILKGSKIFIPKTCR